MHVAVDIETTGDKLFDINQEVVGNRVPLKHRILEIAMVVVDNEFNELGAITKVASLKKPKEEDFHPVAWEMHNQTGLIDDINDLRTVLLLGNSIQENMRNSLIFYRDINREFLDFLHRYSVNNVPLLGSGVHFDKAFIEIYFPMLLDQFSYQLEDTSVIGRFLASIDPKLIENRPRQIDTAHRALNDARHAVQTYKFFYETIQRINNV